MLRKHLIISTVIVLLGLGSVRVLPTTYELQPAAVNLAFPVNVGEWKGVHKDPGEREQKVLDSETEFSKRLFYRESPYHLGEAEVLDATMVLSGEDMNNSIHRPERCLHAQGFEKIIPSKVRVDIGEGKQLEVTRLQFVQKLKEGGEIPAIMYYWFVGADHITSSHYGRTLHDIKYRLTKGANQRWAYISIQAGYGDLRVEGVAPSTEAQADEFLQDFVRRTFFPVHKTEQIRGWENVKPAEFAAAE